MRTFPPIVSVVTPVLNGGRYVEDAIRSVLAAGDPRVEHVVVDGGSTDGTVEILRRFADRFPGRLRFVSEPDRGACDAWNKGWRLARGEILGFLGADDLYEPGAIGDVIRFFREHPEVAFAHGGVRYIDEEGRELERILPSPFDLDRALNVEVPALPAVAAFYRRSLVERVGPLDASLHCCDFDYWLRAARHFAFHRLPFIVVAHRIHEGSVTARLIHSIYPHEEWMLRRRHGGRLLSPAGLEGVRHAMRRAPLIRTLLALRRRWRSDAWERRMRAARTVAIHGVGVGAWFVRRRMERRGREVRLFLDPTAALGEFLGLPRRRPAEWFADPRPPADAVVVIDEGRVGEVRAEARRCGFPGPVVGQPDEP